VLPDEYRPEARGFHRVAFDTDSIPSTGNFGTHSKATRFDHRKAVTELTTRVQKINAGPTEQGNFSGWSKPRNRSPGHPMIRNNYGSQQLWLATTTRPDGYNGSQSLMPKGHRCAQWKQMTASAVVWQAWQRTEQRHVRNNNGLWVARFTIHPANPRNIGHTTRVSIARQSPLSAHLEN